MRTRDCLSSLPRPIGSRLRERRRIFYSMRRIRYQTMNHPRPSHGSLLLKFGRVPGAMPHRKNIERRGSRDSLHRGPVLGIDLEVINRAPTLVVIIAVSNLTQIVLIRILLTIRNLMMMMTLRTGAETVIRTMLHPEAKKPRDGDSRSPSSRVQKWHPPQTFHAHSGAPNQGVHGVRNAGSTTVSRQTTLRQGG